MSDIVSNPVVAAPPVDTTIIEPRSGWQPIDFGDLWHYRELLWILALRDVRVRYKQTVLGAAWAVIQPTFQTIAFVAFFSGYTPKNIAPPVFFFCGLLPWQLFSTALTSSSNSLVGSQNLITKIYFPRLVIPIAAVITALVDFAISLVLFFILMAVYHVAPTPMILLMPLFTAMTFLAALAVGLWMSALNVEFRDIRYIIPFVVQFLVFVTPVIYPASHFQGTWKYKLLALNPMTGAVEGFRWCVLGTEFEPGLIAISVVVILVLLVGGLFYFRRMERSFADVI